MTDWITDAVAKTVEALGETDGGRIISAFANTGSPEREKIANLLVAALAQNRNGQALAYLADQAGVSQAPQAQEAAHTIDPSRPKLVRPNGKTYYARKWGELWDVDVLKKAREIGQYVLALGPPGTGKTAMVEAAFGEELISTVVTGDTMVSNLVGTWVPDGMGSYRWARGPLQVAVEEGRPILIDEILLANPTVLPVLYPLMDGRGWLDVEENPEIGKLYAKDGFYIVGASNPDVPGAKLSGALARRFQVHVEVTSDWELARALGADERVVTVLEALSLAASGRNASISWSPQFSEAMAFKELEEQFGRTWAIRNLMRLVPKGDLEEVTTRVAPLLGGLDAVRPAKI